MPSAYTEVSFSNAKLNGITANKLNLLRDDLSKAIGSGGSAPRGPPEFQGQRGRPAQTGPQGPAGPAFGAGLKNLLQGPKGDTQRSRSAEYAMAQRVQLDLGIPGATGPQGNPGPTGPAGADWAGGSRPISARAARAKGRAGLTGPPGCWDFYQYSAGAARPPGTTGATGPAGSRPARADEDWSCPGPGAGRPGNGTRGGGKAILARQAQRLRFLVKQVQPGPQGRQGDWAARRSWQECRRAVLD